MNMTTTNFGTRRRAKTSTTARKSRVRTQSNGIVEGEYFPVRVISAEDGGVSQRGNYITYFELKHLVTNATFRTCIFGNNLPNSVESKILDCALSNEINDYDPEDLIGGSFEVLVSFNTKDGNTYINVTDVRPLQPAHQKLLKPQKESTQQPTIMRNWAEDDEDADGLGLFHDEEPYSQVKQKQQAFTEDEMEDDFEGDSETAEEDEFFICEHCRDTGCELCNIELDLSSDDEECINCDGRGCEICEAQDEESDEDIYTSHRAIR